MQTFSEKVEEAYENREKAEKHARRIVMFLAIVFLTFSAALAFADTDADLRDIPGGEFGMYAGTTSYNTEITVAVGQNETIAEAETELQELGDWVTQLLRPAADGLINFSRGIVHTTSRLDLLTAGFEDLAGGNSLVYKLFEDVHKNAVIPIANVIATVVFVVGLIKLFANQSSAEAGIDLWKVIMIFICYAGALAVINASWEVMRAMYALAVHLIQDIYDASLAVRVSGSIQNMFASGASPTKGITSGGVMIACLIVSVLMVLVAIVCMIIINVMIIVRGFEIYLYACFSPVAFAFAVTEGGRQMTETFLKRFLAVLLAGAIQMLLMMVLAVVTPTVGLIPNTADQSFAGQMSALLLSFVPFVVIAWMMTRSTSLAKDLIGTS